jgi:23S rRNA (guanosine2251-2'-O)-methyltransferase
MGNEETGLATETLKLCDDLVKIPLALGGVDSLNVSVATGVFLFEINRQRIK